MFVTLLSKRYECLTVFHLFMKCLQETVKITSQLFSPKPLPKNVYLNTKIIDLPLLKSFHDSYCPQNQSDSSYINGLQSIGPINLNTLSSLSFYHFVDFSFAHPIHTLTLKHIHLHLQTHIRLHLHTLTHVCTYICMCICVYS